MSPWLLVGTVAGAKLATILVVVWLAWSPEAGLLVAVTSWAWVVLGAALLAGPVAWRVRLRRVRARRAALLRAEWMVEGDGRLRPRAPEPRPTAGRGGG